jgi:hypothetical protein
VLYARVPDPAERAPQLSNGFVLVLRKCLTRDRARRYATPAEVSADLERVRERRAPEVKRSALEPLSRRARPVRRAVAAGALALVLVGAAWLALRSSDDARSQAQSGAPGADAIERLSQAADGGARGLSRAMSDAEALHGSAHLTVDQAMRVQDLRRKIRQRLEDELADFERASEANLAGLCADRRFDVAENSARGLRKELAQRVGSEPLPPQLEEDFDRWLSDQAQIVRAARTRAEQEFTDRAARYCKERVVPAVDRLESLGRWRDAQVVLSSDLGSPNGASSLAAVDPELAGASAELSAQGLSSDAVERSVSAARMILEPRRKLLEQDWKAVDVEMKAWIDARVAAWRAKLEGRQASDAAAELATEWSGELARRNLTVEQMPLGWLRLAQEAFVQGTKDLAALEKRLANEDALKSFERLEDDAADLWRQRRYGEAAAVYEESRDDAWRRTVRASMDLRAREAHLLEAFLARAAQGVRARDGRDVELRAGTISYAGRLRAGPDPLGSGFQLTLSGGKVTKLALRAVSGADSASTALLAADSVEALAALAPDVETRAGAEELAARDQLVRALLRYRDGDPYGARAMLNAGPLPNGEPLVGDLEARIASALGQQKSSEGEERARLREKLYWLRREYTSKGNREQARRWADELLASTSDALQPDEIADVRRMRDDLAAEAKPSTEQSIAAIFGPSEQSIVGPNKNRVRMTFLFNQATAGAFKPGAWSADGRAWASEYAAKNDAEMLDRAAPTLALVDPLRVQSDDLDVRLTIEEPADSKPDLLLVSVAGFHVALAGAGNGRPARCLIEALEPARVVEHVRAGAGREFAGLRSGVTHELHIVVNRARGTATVELDGNGRKIAESQPQPRDAAPTLSVRSFEPVRMLKAVVECARR